MTAALVKTVTKMFVFLGFFFSLYFDPHALSLCLPRKSPNLEDLPLEHVAGDKYIYEELLGLKFRISPHAFFQVRMIQSC